MKLSKSKIVLIALVNFLLFSVFSTPLLACGPFFDNYIYSPEDIDGYYPLKDTKTLFESDPGMILSNWGPEYLYPLYMKLNGNELNSEVSKQLQDYYKRDYHYYENLRKEAIEEWKKARGSVKDNEVEINEYKRNEDGNYFHFVNCGTHAFLTAKETLGKRANVYSDEQLKSWVKRQDEVFSNCGGVFDKKIILTEEKQSFLQKLLKLWVKIKDFFAGDKKTPETKKELSPEELFEYDKEYQNAALNFYQGNFDSAEEKFRQIAEDYNHPWREYAVLVVGRIYLRKASLGTVKNYEDSENPKDIKKAEEIRNKVFQKADEEFKKILKDDSLSLVHESAQNLRDFILFRVDPQARLKKADEIMLTSNNPDRIIANLDDFSTLWYRELYRKSVEDKIDEDYEEFKKFVLKDGGDFSQWLYTWWKPGKESLELALKKYKKTNSPAWLLASLKLVTPDHSSLDRILKEVEKIPQNSPGYLTANYYRIKLLSDSGKKQEAKKELENLLASTDFSQKPLSKNYFLNLRMVNSNNFDEALKYSLRNVVTTYNTYEPDYLHRYQPLEEDKNDLFLDKKIKETFNQSAPLEKWSEVVLDETILTPEIRQRMAAIAFVRAVLLDNWEIAEKMAGFLITINNNFENNLSGFMTAQDQEEKKFSTTLFILGYSDLNHSLTGRFDRSLAYGALSGVGGLDLLRRNWWCVNDPEKENFVYYDPEIRKPKATVLNQFLSDDEIKRAQTENEIIYNVIAPNFLGEIVIDYSTKHPQDSRVPEALHMVVDATHYAQCVDEKTTNYSKKAYQLLHNNYPGSYWAKETPYWY